MKKTAIFTVFVYVLLCSCTPEDYYYKDLVENKDIVYPGKITDLSYSSGHHRFAMDFTLSKDQQVNKMIVFWNNRADSIAISIKEHEIGQAKQIIVEDIPEATYDFEIYTQNKYNIRSIPTRTTGRVYGDEYIATLHNRVFLDGGFDRGRAWLEWIPEVREDFIYTKITYETKDGKQQIIEMPKDTDWTYLDNYKTGTKVYFQAAYQPQEQTLDVYYTSSDGMIVPE